MADEIDRDQEFNERHLEKQIENHRFKAGATPSLYYCRICSEAIDEKRRLALPGVTTCTNCQEKLERRK